MASGKVANRIPGLKEHGLKKGDIVILTSGYEEAGGTIFQIVEDTPPVKPHTTQRTEKHQAYDYYKKEYTTKEHVVYGAWDEKGRKIMAAAIEGFIRIKPVFSFYPSYKAANPKGKGGTIIVQYNMLRYVQAVDLVQLCSKHAELASVIKDVVKYRSEEDGQPGENS